MTPGQAAYEAAKDPHRCYSPQISWELHLSNSTDIDQAAKSAYEVAEIMTCPWETYPSIQKKFRAAAIAVMAHMLRICCIRCDRPAKYSFRGTWFCNDHKPFHELKWDVLPLSPAVPQERPTICGFPVAFMQVDGATMIDWDKMKVDGKAGEHVFPQPDMVIHDNPPT